MLDVLTKGVLESGIAEDVAQQWLRLLQSTGSTPFSTLSHPEAVTLVESALAAYCQDSDHSPCSGARPDDGDPHPQPAAVALALARRVGATLPQLTSSLFLLEEALKTHLDRRGSLSLEQCRAISAFFHRLLVAIQEEWLSGGSQGAPLPANSQNGFGEKDRILDDFVSLASHELRTPLTSIKAYTQLAQRRLNKLSAGCTQPVACGVPEFKEHLNVVASQVNRLSRLVNELLEVARLREGRFEVKRQPADLVNLVQAAVSAFRMTVPTRQVILEELEGTLPADLDADRLDQVIYNLLSNGVRFSPGGDPITVRIQRVSDLPLGSRHDAVISVTDRGLGISPKDLPHIFERFFHPSDPEAARLSGLGLGLFVSEKIVAAHDGRMWAESQPGQGSTFYFAIPLTPAAS